MVKDGRTDANFLARGKVLAVGDSPIRYLDRNICTRDRKCRIQVCFPVVKIAHIWNKMHAWQAKELSPLFA